MDLQYFQTDHYLTSNASPGELVEVRTFDLASSYAEARILGKKRFIHHAHQRNMSLLYEFCFTVNVPGVTKARCMEVRILKI